MHDPTRRSFIAASAAAVSLGPVALATRQVAPGAAVERFLGAVCAGDLTAATTMLDQDHSLLAACDRSGRSAFALAYLHEHSEIGAMIRDRGYAPDLHESALALDWERFASLAETRRKAIDRAHPIGGSAMVAAALGGAGSEIWRVYAEAADPNARPAGRHSPSALRAAFKISDLRRAELTAAMLLANGADPNQPEPRGDSTLHVAAARGSLELVEMLVRKGAEVHRVDDEGLTPLRRAEAAGHEAVAALLRDHAMIPRDHDSSRRVYDVHGAPYVAPDLADLDLVRRSRFVGASHFDMDTVRRESKAEPRLVHAIATTTEGAVEACSHTGRQPIVEHLLELGAPYSIVTAASRGDVPRVRALLAEDPLRVHERGPHDFALLWYPVIGDGSIALFEVLVNAGAEIERQHHLGTTALHHAAIGGTAEEIEWLIANGADVNRIGRKFGGEPLTPLDLARRRGRPEIEKLLLARGALG